MVYSIIELKQNWLTQKPRVTKVGEKKEPFYDIKSKTQSADKLIAKYMQEYKEMQRTKSLKNNKNVESAPRNLGSKPQTESADNVKRTQKNVEMNPFTQIIDFHKFSDDKKKEAKQILDKGGSFSDCIGLLNKKTSTVTRVNGKK